MNVKHLFCSNCQNEEINDNLFNLGLENSNIIYKTNNTDVNKKSVISTSDNNNSTDNNLEIIEYPYSNSSNDNNNNNNGYTQESPLAPLKSQIINKKKFNDFHNFCDKIKPPRLFIEDNKENIQINILKNNIINKENKSNEEIIENNNNENDINLKPSLNNSFIIQNEDNLLNNKAFLTKYSSNTYNASNNKENENEKKDKNNINEINNKNNNHNNKNISNISNNINGIKVDYPKPDTNSFLAKNNKKNTFKIKIQDNSINVNQLLTDIQNKTQKMDNIQINKNIKNIIRKHSELINFKIIKNIKNIKNNKKINSDTQKYISNNNINKNKNNNNIYNKFFNHNDKSEKNIIKVKLNSKIFKINKKVKTLIAEPKSKIVCSLKKFNNNVDKNMWLKTEYNENNLLKTKTRFLSNGFLTDLLLNRTNIKNKNNFSNYNEKHKRIKKFNTQIGRPSNENRIYSSKTYSNPFLTQYRKKKISTIK